MDLPLRILLAPPAEPVVSVDGAFGAPGLNLSHWPGNTTPADLKHDLSTGSALAFARLEAGERVRRAAGAVAIANNHYDTDGCCAALAVRHPRRALALAPRLLATAACGDFYRVPDEEAFAVDAVVSNLVEPDRSPLAGELAALDSRAAHERALVHAVELLPALLAGDLAPHRPLWEPELERLRADRALLAACARAEESGLDLTVWSAPPGTAVDAPGRHALFGATAADRALWLGPAADGTRARLVVSTLSWFDLVSERRLPRPDLLALAEELNRSEGTDPGEPAAWRAQPATNASPELWFGGAELESFAEHNALLAPSRLAPDRILERVRAALRSSRGAASPGSSAT